MLCDKSDLGLPRHNSANKSVFGAQALKLGKRNLLYCSNLASHPYETEGSSSRDLLSLCNYPKSRGVTRVFSNNICNDLRKALATSALTPKRTSQVAIEVPINHLQTQCPHSKHPM